MINHDSSKQIYFKINTWKWSNCTRDLCFIDVVTSSQICHRPGPSKWELPALQDHFLWECCFDRPSLPLHHHPETQVPSLLPRPAPRITNNLRVGPSWGIFNSQPDSRHEETDVFDRHPLLRQLHGLLHGYTQWNGRFPVELHDGRGLELDKVGISFLQHRLLLMFVEMSTVICWGVVKCCSGSLSAFTPQLDFYDSCANFLVVFWLYVFNFPESLRVDFYSFIAHGNFTDLINLHLISHLIVLRTLPMPW